MSANAFPPEVFELILKDEDKATLISASEAGNLTLSHAAHRRLLDNLVLKGADDVGKFLNLIHSPFSTFPRPLSCKSISLQSSAFEGAGIRALSKIINSTLPPSSLEIRSSVASVLRPIIRVLGIAWAGLQHLRISGGTHTPSAFFDQLAALPQLTSLHLHRFQFDIPAAIAVQYAFPPGLKHLTISQSTPVWTFLRSHVIPGGGFGEIRVLSIQARFCLQAQGVADMIACLVELRNVETLELDALHRAHCLDLDRSMRQLFTAMRTPLLRIAGLKHFRLDFSKVPANLAFEFIVISAIYLPYIDTDLAITIDLPRSSALWDHADPEEQLRVLLDETSPPGTPTLTPQSSIVVRGFPGALPLAVQQAGSAQVCGYPIAFVVA